MTAPETHHCPCTTLLLALPATYTLASLPHRRAESLTSTLILPIPLPTTTTTTSPLQPRILNSALDLKPLVVRRSDGFEKRWLWRCQRCGVPWGYQLAPEVSRRALGFEEGDDREEGGEGKVGKEGESVVYLLDGAFVGTGELVGRFGR